MNAIIKKNKGRETFMFSTLKRLSIVSVKIIDE